VIEDVIGDQCLGNERKLVLEKIEEPEEDTL
jgi:hypothetical protein